MNISTWIRAACLAAPVALLAGCGGGGDLDGGMTAKAVTVDSNGFGFVGKGDVQLALEWNNKQTQDGAGSVAFRRVSQAVQTASWTCSHATNGNTQNRQTRLETTTTAITTSVARVSNQVTGFNLLGHGSASTSEVLLDGQDLNSCPNGAGWELTSAGALATESSSWRLEVSGPGTGWVVLKEENSGIADPDDVRDDAIAPQIPRS
jgi:hypothetical protein